MSYSAMADDFLPELNHIVTLTPTTVTGNNTRIPGTPHQYHARIEQDAKAVYTATGQVVFSTGRVLLHPKSLDGTVLTAVNPDMMLTLPDGTKSRILTIGAMEDEVGIVYYEVRT